MDSSKKLLLIDGNNLFHRAYHALPPLNDKSGQNTNAVYGFSNMILKAISEVKPVYIACAFDTKAPTFRHVEFEAYKAQRVAPPPDLYPQFPIVKQVLDAFEIKYFEKAGYEADDVLASIAKKFQISNFKYQIVILSGDRDLLQLVDGDIKVQAPGWNLATTTLFGSAEVEEKYGITPEQMVDYKAMTGDQSDNIPGISGIGPKTASALLQKYKTLEGIYGHIDEVGETTRVKLEKDKDVALAAKKLVKLDIGVDISYKLSELRFKPDWEKVINEFEGLGFKSIMAKIQGVKVSSSFAKASEDKKVSKVSNAENNKNDSNQLELI